MQNFTVFQIDPSLFKNNIRPPYPQQSQLVDLAQ